AEELAAANTYNAGRYRYEAPNDNPDEQTSYQKLINMLNTVAGDETLYNNAAAATEVGAAFSHLVNAAQGNLYPDAADRHNGQLDSETMKDVMAGSGNASTPVGLEEDNIFIPEGQVDNRFYPHFESERLGDFRVSGGFMEPNGHSRKPASRALRTDGAWMETAMQDNFRYVQAAEVQNLITTLHNIAQDDALRDAAVAANTRQSPEFARLVYAAQLQLYTREADIDGVFGPTTRRLATARSTYLDAIPMEVQANDAENGEGENANPANDGQQVMVPAVDPFVYQMAPFTEMYEGRHARVQGGNTIGVNFNLGAADAAARLEGVGANHAEIVAGTAQLTDEQINALYYADMQNLGVNRAQGLVPNYNNLATPLKMALADICFSFGTGEVTGLGPVFTAMAVDDYNTAGDRFAESAFF
ncbi:MAG: hypothetical protein AAF570_26075, partial [Bacteroidota bacterium]